MAITPITVPLSEAITHGKITYSELTFARKLKGKDLIAIDAVQGGMKRTYAMYASLCDVPLQVFYEIYAEDLELIAQAVATLTGESSKATDESEKKAS